MSREDTRRYLVAYDIPDDRRRTQVAKKLESFGDRVQYSVFIVDAPPAKLVRLRTELLALLVTQEDSVLVCTLGPVASCGPERFEFLGRTRRITVQHRPLTRSLFRPARCRVAFAAHCRSSEQQTGQCVTRWATQCTPRPKVSHTGCDSAGPGAISWPPLAAFSKAAPSSRLVHNQWSVFHRASRPSLRPRLH